MSDPIQVQSTQVEESAPGTGTYHMTRESRRQAIILLVGVASLWVFALWTLTTLFQDGLSGVEWVSILLMLAILLVAPLVAWALLEEANSRYIVSDENLRYQSLGGVDITYNWSELSAAQGAGKGRLARFFLGDDIEEPPREVSVSSTDGDSEEETNLLRVPDHSTHIANPVARILHGLAHGSTLPVYGGVENRDELLATILTRTAITDNAVAGATPTVAVQS